MSEESNRQYEGTDGIATDLATLRAELQTLRKELDILRGKCASATCGAGCCQKSDLGKEELVSSIEIGGSVHVNQAGHVERRRSAEKTRTWLACIKHAIEEELAYEHPVRQERCHAILTAIEGLSGIKGDKGDPLPE